MSTSDEDVERLAARLRTEPKIWVPYAADMLLALKAERSERQKSFDHVRSCLWTSEARAEAAEKRSEKLEAALTEMSEWRKIETAPKDGSIILMWAPHGPYLCAWNEGLCDVEGWSHGYWSQWLDGEEYHLEALAKILTHWMPLPEPPHD